MQTCLTIHLITMKLPVRFAIGLLLIWMSGAAHAVSAAQDEINHLLDFVARSECKFNRNGSWVDAREARRHLQKKYTYLAKRDLAPDAERFIARAASESSMSGQPYRVQCSDREVILSATWLSNELLRFRKEQGKTDQVR